MLTKDMSIKIPGEIKRALKISEKELGARLRLELAVHLYEEWLLSFGKAAEFSEMSRLTFAEVLSKRQIVRHYTEEDLEEDIAFAEKAGEKDGRQ